MNMNTSDEAYKLAASFYLSSCHDDWTGERLRKAILADINGDDEQAIADQQELEVWDPIERHICRSHPMADPYEELDDLIDNLAYAFLQFAKGDQNIVLP
jgi:hypothetical protein